MKIEKEQVQLTALQLTATPQGGQLTVLSSQKTYNLNPVQYSYLDVLKNGTSLESLVQFFLGQGWLVNFRELVTLLEFLIKEHIIQNKSFHEYFFPTENRSSYTTSEITSTGVTAVHLEKNKLPFFRSLEPKLADYLLQKAAIVKVNAQTRVTKTGDSSRDLFILLKGQAGIYKVQSENTRQLVATISDGALFGERSFLMNQPRTADIITLSPCEILRIQHLPEFDQFIKTDKALSLQHRFLVLQALHSSSFFKNLPGDSLDHLIFSGKLCKASANQVLFQEGQSASSCFILIQGSVVISQKGHNIGTQNQGTCFGEIALLMSGGKRTATITAQQESILLEIHQNDFYKVLASNLLLAKEIESLAAERLAKDAARNRS